MTARTPSLALLAAVCAVSSLAVAQDPRPVAFTNARLLPMSGPAIERGTLVVRNGKIEALGADVAVPAGARVVDATGLTILPGLVSAWSRAGLGGGGQPRFDDGGGRRGGRRGQPMPMPEMGGGSAQNRAATKVVDGLYARQEVFGELLRAGVTSLALTPSGAGLPGLGAVLLPDGKTTAQLTLDDDAFVQIGMARDAQAKKLLKESFEKAQKLVEERKKPPEPPKPAEPPAGQKPPEGKPAEAKTEPPKGETPPSPAPGPNPQPTPPKPEEKKDGPPPQGQPAQAPPRREPPKDPNLEVLADLLEGKRRAIVQIDSAADLLHWQQVVPDTVKFPRAIAVTRHDPTSGTVETLLDGFKALQAPLLLPPDLSTLPRSRFLTHPARALHEAGVEIGFLIGDNPGTVRQLFFRLMELVRCGLPADVALRGVTLVPAKALGIDARTGSLEPGKSADLLVFDGDPLQPTTTLRHVWLQGREIPLQP